jgi:hypothetical protein
VIAGGRVADAAEAHRVAWRSVMEDAPDGAAALFVGHGGGIEPVLVASLPDADHDSWGNPSPTATVPPWLRPRQVHEYPIPAGADSGVHK